ncbi:hypothetical protein [Jiangella muralis]|uniref:hypothetical protein n=1 Tax=Jiangella muralis TaxID=702383 RepID=UPI00069EEFBE|nr:hypothetical protein [Jiangella muralis]
MTTTIRQRRPSGRRRTLLLPAALTALLALAVAGCGDDSSDGVSSLETEAAQTEAASDPTSGGGGGGGAAEDELEQAQAFAECMRENGFDMPDPEIGPDGSMTMQGLPMGDPVAEAALDACADLMPASQSGGDVDEGALQDALLAYAQCMRENGYDMPDPDFSGGAIPLPSVPQEGDDPALLNAHAACEDILASVGS